MKKSERDAIADEMQRKCRRCGKPFGVHGAAPPHTRGDECEGFTATHPERAGGGE